MNRGTKAPACLSPVSAGRPLVPFVAMGLVAATLQGCVTKAKARADAEAAFLAGQRQARAMMGQGQQMGQFEGQAQGLIVTFQGDVKRPLVPWTPEMTLAKAIVVADYYGTADPTEIFIVRKGRAIPVDPKQLLNGQDVPLEPGDLVHLGQPAVTP